MNCAAKGCDKPVTYEKPLCYPHWLEFDSFEIEECEKCHYFSDDHRSFDYEGDEPVLCWDCRDGKAVVVHDHAPIEIEWRDLYILELDGGDFYIGQTSDVEARLVEHKQGTTQSTKGRNPELVWFKEFRGNKWLVLEREKELTLLKTTHSGRREIIEMILDWQRPLRNIKFLNGPSTNAE